VLFISNRDIVVRSSKAAQAIRFVKGEPQEVPKAMYDEVMAVGIMPAEEKDAPSAQTVIESEIKNKPKLAPDDGAERAEAILSVIEAIVEKNSPKDFTGGAVPAAASVTAALGWKVDQKEVADVWKKNRERIHAEKRDADAATAK
jgi:hypothetical protein